MKRGLMWVALALALLAPGLTLAGFGGMGNVEHDGGDVSIADMLIGGALIWGVYALWKKFF